MQFYIGEFWQYPEQGVDPILKEYRAVQYDRLSYYLPRVPDTPLFDTAGEAYAYISEHFAQYAP